MKAIIKTRNTLNKLRTSFQGVNEITNNTINSNTNYSNTKNFLIDTLFKKKLMSMSIYENLTKNYFSGNWIKSDYKNLSVESNSNLNSDYLRNNSILKCTGDKNNMNKDNQGLEKEKIDKKFNSDRTNGNGNDGKLKLFFF